MKERNLRGVIAVALGVCVSVGLFATNAIAKPAPVTKIGFKLDDHNVPPGSPVTSDVLVRTRSNHELGALRERAPLGSRGRNPSPDRHDRRER